MVQAKTKDLFTKKGNNLINRRGGRDTKWHFTLFFRPVVI